MTAVSGTDLLAPGARFGHWWIPHEPGSDDRIKRGMLPDSCAAGAVGVQNEGHWQLLKSAAGMDRSEVDAKLSTSGIERRETIWGQTRNESVSLFDGWCIRPRSILNRENDEVWVGNWRAESRGAWVEPHDRASRVEIEFDVAAAWSEPGLAYGREVDLTDAWDPQTRSAALPDPLVRRAEFEGAQISLCLECLVDSSAESLSVRVRTYFLIEEHLAFADIQERWVRPLFEMLSFCFADSARVTDITARDAEHGRHLGLYYPEPLATTSGVEPDGATRLWSQFVVMGDLAECGISFEAAIPHFLEWYKAGGAAALTLLVDSQRPLLDRSVGSRLLSVAMSLEAHEKATPGHNGQVNLRNAVELLLARSGSVGEDLCRLWALRGGKELHRSLPELRARHAAHGHSGHESRFESVQELLDLEHHVAALQWLLRWRYLQRFGLSENDSARLVTEARGYKGMLRAAEAHFDIA